MMKPKNKREYFLLGNLNLEKYEFKEAINCYQKAILMDYKDVKIHNNLGIAFKNLNKIEKAYQEFTKAIKLDPHSYHAYNNLGNILIKKGEIDKAVEAYKKAIHNNKYYAPAYNNLGTALHNLGEIAQAKKYYKKAVTLNPYYGDAYNNLGVALRDRGKIKEAIKEYKKALEIHPNYAEVYYNLGLVYNEAGKLDKGIEATKKAIEILPEYQDANHQLAQFYKNTCKWKRARKQIKKVDKLTKIALKEGFRPGETPFFSITTFNNPKRNRNIARAWSNYAKEQACKFNFEFNHSREFRRRGSKRITLAYLSSDFRNHAIAHQSIGLFKHHNRKKFKVLAYSYGKDDKSYYRKFVQKHTDSFIDISNMGNLQAAKKIYNDQVDILIDLNGHTKGARLELIAMKPAPIQINYLGFPGTIGADFIDYIIADKTIIPKSQQRYYDEKLIYMPDSYQISSYDSIEKKSQKEKYVRVQKSSFVFCSFNNSYKIDKEIFSAWMRILKSTPNSILWLTKENKISQEVMIKEAKKKGVVKNRLVFLNRVNLPEHLERLKYADIALDTIGYNGGATTSNALYMGVPVITVSGENYISRMSASLLKAVEMDKLIARDLNEYELIAISLANNPRELIQIKNKLRQSRNSNLFNTLRFTRNLERAYKKVWKNYMNNKKPAMIEI